MNKLAIFLKMHTEVSFASPLCIEDAIRIVRENTYLTPDIPVEKAERDKYMFVANDKNRPSLNAITPNMHVYGQMTGVLTPVFNIEFSATGKSDHTDVKIISSPDPGLLSMWIAIDVLCVLIGLVFLAIAVMGKDYRHIFGFVFSLVWIFSANLIGFWIPYKSAMNDLMTMLEVKNEKI